MRILCPGFASDFLIKERALQRRLQVVETGLLLDRVTATWACNDVLSLVVSRHYYSKL